MPTEVGTLVGRMVGDMKGFTTEVTKSIGSLDKLGTQATTTSRTVQRSGNAVQQAFKGLGQFTRGVASQVQVAARSVEGFSRRARWALLGVTGALTAAVWTGARFEQSMANVASVSGAVGEEFRRLKGFAREMGATTVFSASQAADGMYSLASAGLNATQQIAALPGVLELAAATQADLAFATETVVSSLNAFGLESGQAGRVANVFAAAIGASQATMDKLALSLRYTGPLFAQAGRSIKENVAALALLYDAGFRGEQAGTVLRAAFSRLLNPTGEMERVIRDLGLTLKDLDPTLRPLPEIIADLERRSITAQQAMALFSVEAGPGMLALSSQGSDALREMERRITGTQQATEMARRQLDTFSGDLRLMRSAAEEAGNVFFDNLNPALRQIVQNVTALIRRFNTLEPEQQTVMVRFTLMTVAGLAAAAMLGTLATGVAVALTLFGLMISGISALLSPLGLLIVLVAGLALAWATDFKGLRTTVTEWVADVKAEFEGIRKWFQTSDFAAPIRDMVARIRETWANQNLSFLQKVTTTVDIVIETVKLLWEQSQLRAAVDDFVARLKEIWSDEDLSFAEKVKLTVDAALELGSAVWDIAKGLLQDAWDTQIGRVALSIAAVLISWTLAKVGWNLLLAGLKAGFSGLGFLTGTAGAFAMELLGPIALTIIVGALLWKFSPDWGQSLEAFRKDVAERVNAAIRSWFDERGWGWLGEQLFGDPLAGGEEKLKGFRSGGLVGEFVNLAGQGGATGRGPVSDIAGVVHRGEWIAPAWMVRALRPFFAMLEGIRRRRGFQAGGAADVELMPGITAASLAAENAAVSSQLQGVQDDTVQQVVAWMDEVSKTFVTALRDLVDKLPKGQLRDTLGGILDSFVRLTETLGQETVEKEIEDLRSFFTEFDSFGPGVAAIRDTRTLWQGFLDWWGGTRQQITQTTRVWQARLGWFWDELRLDPFNALTGGLKDFLQQSWRVIQQDPWGALEAGLQGFLQAARLGKDLLGSAGMALFREMLGSVGGGAFAELAPRFETRKDGDQEVQVAANLAAQGLQLGQQIGDAIRPSLEATLGGLGTWLANQFAPLGQAMGGFLGVVLALVTQSRAFQRLMSTINRVLQPLVDAIVLPIVRILEATLIPVLQALMPIIEAWAQWAMPILFTSLKLLGLALLALVEVFLAGAWVVAMLWNAILEVPIILLKAVKALFGWIPGVGKTLQGWIDSLNGLKVNTSGLTDMMGQVWDAMGTLANLSWDAADAMGGAADEAGRMAGVSVSEITGPTRDLLVSLLSPLAGLLDFVGGLDRVVDAINRGTDRIVAALAGTGAGELASARLEGIGAVQALPAAGEARTAAAPPAQQVFNIDQLMVPVNVDELTDIERLVRRIREALGADATIVLQAEGAV